MVFTSVQDKKISEALADELISDANLIITNSQQRNDDVLTLLADNPALPLTESVFQLVDDITNEIRAITNELESRGISVEAITISGSILPAIQVAGGTVTVGLSVCSFIVTEALKAFAAEVGDPLVDPSNFKERGALFLINRNLCARVSVELLDPSVSPQAQNFFTAMGSLLIGKGSVIEFVNTLVQPAIRQLWLDIATDFANLFPPVTGFIKPLVERLIARISRVPGQLFFDDFEDGDVSDWTLINESTGSVSVVADDPDSGTFSVELSHAAGIRQFQGLRHNIPVSSTPIGVSVWVKGIQGADQGILLFDSAGNLVIHSRYLFSDHSAYLLQHTGAEAINNNPPTFNNWHKYTLVVSSTTAELSVDGVPYLSVTGNTAIKDIATIMLFQDSDAFSSTAVGRWNDVTVSASTP